MDYFAFPIFDLVKPALISLLALSALVGAIAVASPQTFTMMARMGNRWVDTWKLFGISQKSPLRSLDKCVDIDKHVLRHSRLFGVILIAAFALLGTCLTVMQ